MALMKSNKSSVIKCRGGASFGRGGGERGILEQVVLCEDLGSTF